MNENRDGSSRPDCAAATDVSKVTRRERLIETECGRAAIAGADLRTCAKWTFAVACKLSLERSDYVCLGHHVTTRGTAYNIPEKERAVVNACLQSNGDGARRTALRSCATETF